jgi:phospholipid-translocating ATPase
LTGLHALSWHYNLHCLLFHLCATLVTGALGNHIQVQAVKGDRAWYLWFPATLNVLVLPGRFLLLCSLMIPISLKVTLDLAKLYQAKSIEWDLQLYSAKHDAAAQARNTVTSDELGKVASPARTQARMLCDHLHPL